MVEIISCKFDTKETQEYLSRTFPTKLLPVIDMYYPKYWTLDEDDDPVEVREYLGLTKEQFPDN